MSTLPLGRFAHRPALRSRLVRSTLVVMRLSRGNRCGLESVARVQGLLASGQPGDRAVAVDCITSWVSVDDEAAAAAILTAAVNVSPPDHADEIDPAVALVEVLWATPHWIDLEEVEAAYLLGRDPVRRALLDLLARRRDPAGLLTLRHVLGDPGWTDHLPLPTPGLLSQVLGHAGVEDLVAILGALLLRPGWEAHASGLLARMAREVGLGAGAVEELIELLEPALDATVEHCDEAIGCRNGGEASVWLWRSRHRVRHVLDVVESIDSPAVESMLTRSLGSADPVVGAWAVAALAARGTDVPWDRVWMAAHEPVSRSVLMERLDCIGLLGSVFDRSGRSRDGVMRAEADLVAWLSRPGELGCLPSEVEHIASREVPLESGRAGFHLFRFRTRAPHWASARGWMVGAAGLYRSDGTVPTDLPQVAVTRYDCEDSASTDDHLDSMAAAAEGE